MIRPYGNNLRNLLLSQDQSSSDKRVLDEYVAVTLNKRQLCDLELLTNGAYSPLEGFMCQEDYDSVLDNMQLANGLLWSLPITLDVQKSVGESLKTGDKLKLMDPEGFVLAFMEVEEIWPVEKDREAAKIYDCDDLDHPGLDYLYNNVGAFYVGGPVKAIQLPLHYDFEVLRTTPFELRSFFEKQGWKNIIAFGTSKPMHRIHREITLKAAKEVEANILIHPSVGVGKPGDIEYFSRVHCYQAILKYYPGHMAKLALLPYSTRMAGPREAIHNAIMRQNYGCSHIIIGPEHGSPPDTRQNGKRFYERYSAQELIRKYQDELDIQAVSIQEHCYVPRIGKFISQQEADGETCAKIGDQQLKDSLSLGDSLPDWFSYPEVLDELRKVYKPRRECGITLFFTGLSGAGKSTLAKLVRARFIEEGKRSVTLLDGDIVRHYLSSELGYSKQDRDTNIKRIGFVASEINKNGGVAICAAIAPYASARDHVRSMNSRYGAFIEIYVATPLDVCERRDRKGFYARARKGEIKQFTGVSDPYECPLNPEITIDTSDTNPMEASQQIMLYLLKEGYLE